MPALIFLLIAAAFVYFYPVTLRFSYARGRGELAWLPRVCGGYAAPRPLRLPMPKRKSRRGLRFSLRRLWRHVILDKLDFCLWLADWGLEGYAECIIHLRGGDIIGDIAHAWWRGKKRRARYAWRT